MSKTLYSVELLYEALVTADSEEEAVEIARMNCHDEDFDRVFCINPIVVKEKIPEAWDDCMPYGDYKGTCEEFLEKE